MTDINSGAKNVIVIEEDLDALTVLHMKRNFEKELEKDEGDLVIDMTEVEFIDSSGIGALVFLFKRLTAANRIMKIKGVHGQPESLFSALRIDKTIPVEFLPKQTEAGDAAARGTGK